MVGALLLATPGVAVAARPHHAAHANPAAKSLGPDPSPQPEEAGAMSDQNAALVRRELARLAAHRIEVAAALGVDVGMRYFRYNDPIGRELRPYKLPGVPMLSFELEAYPLASTDLPVLRDLGFRGRVSRALALDSNTPDGTKIATEWTRFGGEVRVRLLFPGQPALELGVFGGVDSSDFSLKTQAPVAALLPSAHSLSLKLGLDARVQLTSALSVTLASAYLGTSSLGAVYDKFRAASVAGVDGDLGFALGLGPGVEAQLGGRYTRYFSTFHPELGDPYVAGGALDQQLQFGLGVRYAH